VSAATGTCCLLQQGLLHGGESGIREPGAGPLGPRLYSASVPPACQRAAHRQVPTTVAVAPGLGRDEISLTFADVEQVVRMPLPHSARRHPTHWYGYEGTALGRAIRDAGWHASQVNLTDETVVLKRDETQGAGEDES
jgi:hypothetical protein